MIEKIVKILSNLGWEIEFDYSFVMILESIFFKGRIFEKIINLKYYINS